MQAEYRSHLREQHFQEALRAAKDETHARGSEVNEALDAVSREKEVAERQALEAASAMEAQHMRAAEELEHEYERKLAAEAARWEALRKDKEDVQCQLEERIYSLALAGHPPTRSDFFRKIVVSPSRNLDQRDVRTEDLRRIFEAFERGEDPAPADPKTAWLPPPTRQY